MKFKLNLWTSWKVVAFCMMIAYLSFDVEKAYCWIGIFIYLISSGFKNIEDKLGIETNLFKFSWKKKKVKKDEDKRIINE